MAKPNYQYEKRQRELAKKAKKAEKAARRAQDRPEDGALAQTTALPEGDCLDNQATTAGLHQRVDRDSEV